MCATVDNRVVAAGAPIIQSSCTPNQYNQWLPINKVTGDADYYRLQNLRSSLCLNTFNEGGAVTQNTCGAAIHWTWLA